MKMMRDIVNEMVGKGSMGESGGDKMSELVEQCKACASDMGMSVDELMGKIKSKLSSGGDDDSDIGMAEAGEDDDLDMPEKDMKSPKKALIIAMLKKKSAKSSEY